MSKLTAGVCCFALSGFFAWIASSAISSAMSARANATTVGAYLMMQSASGNNGIATLAIVAAIVLLVVGLVCVISGLRSR